MLLSSSASSSSFSFLSRAWVRSLDERPADLNPFSLSCFDLPVSSLSYSSFPFYRIKYLVNPAHKFKVRENAKQNSLTGCCIFNPKFTLVLVEGSAKAIKFYKRVLLVRIDWTEEPRAREADPDDDDSTSLAAGGGSGPGGGVPLGEDGEPVDLDTNRCDLIWEGPIKEKSYGLFRSKNAEGDKAAREFLGEANQGYWDVSRFFPSAFLLLGFPFAIGALG
jgi:hypothetical protein